MLKHTKRCKYISKRLITVQDNTMLKLSVTSQEYTYSLITVQDNTMLKLLFQAC